MIEKSLRVVSFESFASCLCRLRTKEDFLSFGALGILVGGLRTEIVDWMGVARGGGEKFPSSW